MPFYNDFVPLRVALPTTALCLHVPETDGEELVVHRNPFTNENYVFLFEALDDAYDYCHAAKESLGFRPEIARVRVSDLGFETARFKPAVGDQMDVPIHGYRRRNDHWR